MSLFPDRRGKNNKILYYLKGAGMYLTPSGILHHRLKNTLRDYHRRPDAAEIDARVDYYCRLEGRHTLAPDAPTLGAHTLRHSISAYFFDTFEFTRYFPRTLRWMYRFGDMSDIPAYPSIQKARRILPDNDNAVIMKLDKVRHFLHVDDPIPFEQKQNKIIFRGVTAKKPKREAFLLRYHDHPLCDVGDVGGTPGIPQAPKISMYDHLPYKFIMCLEGNDVATNLKWVMSSNSIAVMPRPTCESWYMEGTLLPGVHYIEIKPDFSDLIERVGYYIDHPDEAALIVKNAQAYARRFRDEEREQIISLLVMDKYLKCVNPSK